MDLIKMMKNNIRSNKMDINGLKGLLEEGKLVGELDPKTLLAEGVLAQDKYDILFPPPPPEELARREAERQRAMQAEEQQQKREIREKAFRKEFSHQELKEYVNQGVFTLDELLNAGVIRSEEKKRISPYKVSKPMSIGAQVLDWDTIPPLQKGRVDIFVFGIVGSGKSLLMAGILKHANKNGLLRKNISNKYGLDYTNFLIESVEEGWAIQGTAGDYLQYMTCDVTDIDKEVHPLTFIEIGGESFQKIYLKEKEDLPLRLQQYMFDNTNTKVLFLAVDYTSSEGTKSSQQQKQFEFVLEFLDSHDIVQDFEAIIIVVTKWDRSEDKSDEAAEAFLEDKFMALVNLCKHMKEKHDIDFFIHTFSLGKFINEHTYDYDPQDSKKIFDMLCEYTSIINPGGTKGGNGNPKPWWKRFTK
jgi:hypothetical protein